MPPRKPTPAPQTYAARVARGRVPVTVNLSPDAVALLGELAEARGETRSAVVQAALEALANR